MSTLRYCRQDDRALVRVAGADARSFLHAQTTQSFTDFPADESRLAAWLSPKGRVRALFDVVPDADAFWLMLPADNADWLAAQLRLFVLRAAVELEAATDLVVCSLVGDAGDWLRAQGLALEPGHVAHRDGVTFVALLPSRIDIFGAPGTIDPLLDGLERAGPDIAARAAIAAGRPEIPAALRDRYTPQMLNLDRLDAVSFTKGCYPGQEIVARTQNLGQVKRRIARFRIGAGPCPDAGDAVVTREGEPAGEINRAAAVGDAFEVLAVVGVDADGLVLGSDERVLEPLPST